MLQERVNILINKEKRRDQKMQNNVKTLCNKSNKDINLSFNCITDMGNKITFEVTGNVR